MARPKKEPKALRSHQLNIALTPSEWNRITSNASMLGLNRMAYVRKCLFSKKVIKANIHPVNRKLLVELSREGTNLNQIARKINSNIGVDKELRMQLNRTLRLLNTIKLVLLDDCKAD